MLLASLVLSFGCASAPIVKLHVGAVETRRLAPEVLRPLDDAARASATEIGNDLAHAKERVVRAEAALRQAEAEAKTPETAEVRAAKISRARCELAWQRTLVDVAERRAVVATATAELAKARLLNRTGGDLNVEAFVDQQRRLQAEVTNAQRRSTVERARFDESDRRLSAAKQEFAKRHLSAQLTPPNNP
jgi:hypothetical protein